MGYRDLLRHPNPNIQERWQRAAVVEVGRIGDGVYGTNTKGVKMMHFIPYGKIPEKSDVRLICSELPSPKVGTLLQ